MPVADDPRDGREADDPRADAAAYAAW